MLLVHSDLRERRAVTAKLLELGIHLVAVGRLSEVERWPLGEVVVTDDVSATSFWRAVGAAHVVVLANQVDESATQAGCLKIGLPTLCTPDGLVSAIRSMVPARAERSSRPA